MQYLQVKDDIRLSELSDIVGSRNVEYILSANNLEWAPDIGKQFQEIQRSAIENSNSISYQRKSTILNTLTASSDVFEVAALLSESGWKILSALNTIPNTLRIPETIKLPKSVDILGNGEPVGRSTYEIAMRDLANPPHTIDPSIFNEYSTIKPSQIVDSGLQESSDTFQYFKIPWGDITLYSSIADDSIDFPVYPEELSDKRQANYNTMPDLLYQYEPWYVYNSSGPRQNTYTFIFHRQMWTGNENDGKANELIRFCQANCYPNFNGSAVNVPEVDLYFKGNTLIHGIMNDVSVKFDGPILSDGWYAHCELALTITEISNQSLNYNTVMNLPLIG